MPSDTSEVDAALTAKLLGDAPLMALMPDGVYFDEASKNATRFILIKQMTHADEYQFQGSAFEDLLYLVKAVEFSTSGSGVKAAAARIHTILQDGTLAPTGYSLMRMQRTERVRYAEVDALNADARWQHRGGVYSVMVSP